MRSGGFPETIVSSQYAQISPVWLSIRIRQPSSGVTGGYPQDEQRTTTSHGPAAEVPIGEAERLLAILDFDLIIIVAAFTRLTTKTATNENVRTTTANRSATLRNLFI